MITAIIPCFNEEKTIGSVIRELRQILGKRAQIIVVDNGSSDNTLQHAKSKGVEVYQEPNRGKGFAFRMGLNKVAPYSKIIVLVDGDSTYSLSNLNSDINHVLIDGFDMVVGNRVVQDSQNSPFRDGHLIGNKVFSGLFRKMFSTEINDVLSGYRVLSRGFALSFTGGASRFELETELNAHAFHLSSMVKNSDVVYRARPAGSTSKLRTYYDGAKILRRYLSLWFTERPLMAFSALALPLFSVSFLLLIRASIPFFETGLVPNLPSLVASFGLLILAAVLSVAGVVLDRTNVLRRAFSRYVYMETMRINL